MIKRQIFGRLKDHLDRKEITVLIGPRQVGKTYLMKQLEEFLLSRGEKTIFLNLDLEKDRKLFVSQSALVEYLSLRTRGSKVYVFIDEVQHKEDAGLFLKGIYDMDLPYKFIVSGSGSLDLKAKVKESMAGRKQIFEINPVNFEEFVNFKTDYQYEDRLQNFFRIEDDKTKFLLSEYMVYGGYPRVILAETIDRKRVEIEEIYGSYIEKDITNLLKIEKLGALSDLLRILAAQIGSPVNVAGLSSTIGISNKTIQSYLWYLKETFIIKRLTPFYRNVRSEITKAPVYYFEDVGLRNNLLSLFGLPLIPSGLSGHLFENVVFGLLHQAERLRANDIHFWRTKSNAEVDFVINLGLEIVPIEVKYTKFSKPEIGRSFRSFLNKYHPKRAFVVHLGEEFSLDVESTHVTFVPYYKLAYLL